VEYDPSFVAQGYQPSVHFTRDNRWVIFQASRDGRVDVCAAEVASAGP